MQVSYPSAATLPKRLQETLAAPPYAQRSVTSGAILHKRIFDVVFAALVVVFLLSWLAPLIAVLIKLESKGPAFFKQLRTGKDGQVFYCLKFRSMTVNADADIKQACKNDCRVTKIGAFLRKTSLDEFPQFLNVLKGEMSVVGPRPHMLRHTQEFSNSIKYYMDRHLIMPGITGLAQVSGYRGEVTELDALTKRVNADIYYLHNNSLRLDVKIVWLTVVQLFKWNKNAY